MSVRERWRRGKLARSGQRITDPDEARRTAAYMRAVLQHMDPRRWSGWARALVILWVAWFVISTVIDLLLRRWGRLALSGGILLSFVYLAVLFLHIRGKFERTAEINSFELFE